VPLLDGIRAVAIGFVLLGHCTASVYSTALGMFGVSIFFVLSGYLITRTMLLDEAAHGRLRLGNFYRRRALRIFPAFYAFLITLAVLSMLGFVPGQDRITWLASAAYFRNLAGHKPLTGHLWSLALEEQFYLFWPVLFVATRRHRLTFIGAAVAAFTLWRGICVYGYHGQPIPLFDVGSFYWRTDLRMDTFLIGGAFAIADWSWVKTAPVFLALPILFSWVPLASGSAFLAPLDTVVTAVLLAAVIAWLVANPESAPSRLLSHRMPVMIGILSYSIYLWQQLFVYHRPNLQWWNFAALAFVSSASYLLIERPFLRLRDRNRAEANKSMLLEWRGFQSSCSWPSALRGLSSRLSSMSHRSNRQPLDEGGEA
jgi:peptidoglycan/LPS O-acetylase OafA/YrhL